MNEIKPGRRSSGRREEDRRLRLRIDKSLQILHVGQLIISEMNFDVRFKVIIEETNKIMNTENCSVFLITEIELDRFLESLCSGILSTIDRKRLKIETQDSQLDQSKRPYEFNAGGSGCDLLRIKVFSERYGFRVAFISDRCRFLPGATDLCPGEIQICRRVQNDAECRASGGSTFSVTFPKPA